MFHPKNIQNIDWEASEQAFFDRDPLAFEVILNYYRNSKVNPTFFTLSLRNLFSTFSLHFQIFNSSSSSSPSLFPFFFFFSFSFSFPFFKIIIPHWLPIEVVYEEFKFFSLDVPSDQDHKRISVEIMKIEYKTKLWDAAEYRRIARHKLLTQYQGSLVGVRNSNFFLVSLFFSY